MDRVVRPLGTVPDRTDFAISVSPVCVPAFPAQGFDLAEGL